MTTILIALFVIAIAILAMAVGVIVRRDKKRGELKGSCGGPEINPDCCMKKGKKCPHEDSSPQ